MANPRQRRKMRSSAHRAVKTTNAKSRRKHPDVKAPEVVRKAWDKTKTVKQNYAALGLASSLAQHASGGSERVRSVAVHTKATVEAVGGRTPVDGVPASSGTALRKGFGRIVRDAEGNVVDVVIAEDEAGSPEDQDHASAAEETHWGAPMEDWVMDDQRLVQKLHAAQKVKTTALTAALEERASQSVKSVYKPSADEIEALRPLVHRHGDDVQAMSRDLKLNRWQKTAGELKRAINKAGGVAAILAHPEPSL